MAQLAVQSCCSLIERLRSLPAVSGHHPEFVLPAPVQLDEITAKRPEAAPLAADPQVRDVTDDDLLLCSGRESYESWYIGAWTPAPPLVNR